MGFLIQVPHVHLHIIPKRFSKWFENKIEDDDRAPRTLEDMKEEAEHLKSLIRSHRFV